MLGPLPRPLQVCELKEKQRANPNEVTFSMLEAARKVVYNFGFSWKAFKNLCVFVR